MHALRGSKRRMGDTCVDLADSSLHVLGYSSPGRHEAPARQAPRARLHARRPRPRSLPDVVPGGTVGLLHEAPRGRLTARRRVPGVCRLHAEDGSLTYGEAVIRGDTEAPCSSYDLDLSSGPCERQSLRHRPRLGGRARTAEPGATPYLSISLEPRHDRSALLALAKPATRGASPPRSRRLVRRRSAARSPTSGADAAIRRSIARRRTCSGRPTAPGRRLVPVRRRRAAVLLPGLRPRRSGRSHGRRRTPSPSTTPRPTTSTSFGRPRSATPSGGSSRSSM